jgi:hypothetical protein
MDQNGRPSHTYYTCGQDHNKRNPEWKPFQLLEQHCEECGYDFLEARDMIEERIERKLKCECQLLNDDKEIRRRELEGAFSLNFGSAGNREVDVC